MSEYEAGENSAMADWENALDDLLPEEVEALPSQVAAYLRDLHAKNAELVQLIDDLRDPDPCWYDHHGYCQAHGWMDTEPRCPDARAADLFAATEK